MSFKNVMQVLCGQLIFRGCTIKLIRSSCYTGAVWSVDL